MPIRTIEELRAIPFFKLTIEEKKRLIAETQIRATGSDRSAAIARMAADVLRKSI